MHCFICKETADMPEKLKCGHVFCYLCVRRHLSTREFCPQCYVFIDVYDLSASNQKNDLPSIKKVLNTSEKVLIKEMKKYKLDTSGDLKTLEERYNEFFMVYYYEKRKEKPKPLDKIAGQANLFVKSAKRNKINHDRIFEVLRRLKERLNLQYKK